ncbi:aminotransferase class I/II-fold pyridoxal phosphate-dependent enzyme [Desulfovirgula thermocuniculi]|uniref:aminotransferase class I/II-fold pyridoxal phosphate-dependent enzyme n=1 Tax=Desulfovirgula thermocuniculi TaxID=348842 RepID=UPI0004070926|nr:DegT/DnrJ/EryC1/StrS family aminotransferase [Desulfovirgula thermocuniculi]
MIKSQEETPLLAAVLEHCRRPYARLHVPAHRQGQAVFAPWRRHRGFLKMDLTELPGLDDLHAPAGVIAGAQELAAALFGADTTFFLVNGSTAGIMALVVALCGPEEELLLPRYAHRAVLGGLVFSGARPVFLAPDYLEDFYIPLPLKAETVAGAVRRHPAAKCLLAVHPTYYGLCGDLGAQAAAAHAAGIPLVVDEAHGVHFAFHEAFPPPALACGADAAVQSLHKTGGSLTQSSLLHLKGARVDAARVKAALSWLQTTSPSYLLMASLDGARWQLAREGRRLLESALELASFLRREISRLPGLLVLGEEHLGGTGAARADPTRLVINVRRLGLSGYAVAGLLAREHGVLVEMADYTNLVALVGIGTTRRDAEALRRGLKEISRRHAGSRPLPPPPDLPPLPPARLTPREAWLAPCRYLPLAECAGRVSAEAVCVSPPGIPLVYPGEEITPEVIEYLKWLRAHVPAVQGPADPRLEGIRVVDG